MNKLLDWIMVYIFIILKVLFQSFPDLVGMEFAKVFLAYFLLLFYVHFVLFFFWGFLVFLSFYLFWASGFSFTFWFSIFRQLWLLPFWLLPSKKFHYLVFLLMVLCSSGSFQLFFSPFSHPMGGFRGIFTDFSLNFSLKSLNLPRNHDKIFYTLLERTTRYLYIVIYKQLHPNQSILVCIYSWKLVVITKT